MEIFKKAAPSIVAAVFLGVCGWVITLNNSVQANESEIKLSEQRVESKNALQDQRVDTLAKDIEDVEAAVKSLDEKVDKRFDELLIVLREK